MANFKISKFSVLTAVALCFLAAPSVHANEMINNKVSGHVGGDINQQLGQYAIGDIQVGSLRSRYGAENNKVTGYVGGDINQRVARHEIGRIQVGAIDAAYARNNNVSGYVGGDINQVVRQEAPSPVLAIGAMGDANADYDYRGASYSNGIFENNKVSGHVGGDVNQVVGKGAKSLISVGSIMNTGW